MLNVSHFAVNKRLLIRRIKQIHFCAYYTYLLAYLFLSIEEIEFLNFILETRSKFNGNGRVEQSIWVKKKKKLAFFRLC